jgi:Domain of unknown function (DUF929)
LSRKGRRSGPRRSLTPYLIIVLIAVLGVVAYYIFTQSEVTGGSPLIGKPVDPAILAQLAGVSQQTLNFIGPGGTGSVPTANSSVLLTLNGKPEVLYIGAEYCPFCAAERWALIVALEHFGNFSGLTYMQSAPSPESYPNTSTFTFKDSTFTSNYIAFVPVEQYDRTDSPLMTATPSQLGLMSLYDSNQQIPFIDIGNKYTIVGSQVTPSVLREGGSATGVPYNWTTIAGQLDVQTSTIAVSVDGAANRLIAAICKIDGNMPASTCNQASLVVSYHPGASSGEGSLQASSAALNFPPVYASASRPTPSRSYRL